MSTIFGGFWVLCSSVAFGEAVSSMAPPNHAYIVIVAVNDQLENPITYSVVRHGNVIFQSSPIRVALAGKGELNEGARAVEEQKHEKIDETFDLYWGKSKSVHAQANTTLINLESATGVKWQLEFRAYNEGIAFRYGIPAQDNLKEVTIESESTEFRLAGDPTILFNTCENFTTSHETLYAKKKLSELPTNKLIDVPALIYTPNYAVAITEAGLRNYAGLYLERPADSTTLRTRLAPLPKNPKAVAVVQTPFWSPWRVIMLADRAGDLIASNLLVSLNDPPKAGVDYSFATPGKVTWHWWNGSAEVGKPASPPMNFEYHKQYIDFCAANNILYHSVVADHRTWYMQSNPGYGPGPDSDVSTPRPELELPKILAYAKEKGIRIRFWVHWKSLEPKLEEAFAQYEKWGVAGLMVDFLDREDQEMVQFCDRVMESATRHKLHVQFHGSYKPTGEERTWPNLVNREGVLNLEYLKWGNECDPAHNVNVAYTRNLAGPADYHLGGFRSVSREKFKPQFLNPVVLGTRCHQLALYVVFENPQPMVSDTPEAYKDQPGFEFLKEVPTTWDETRFLSGKPGEFVVVARRAGKTWYVGGITNWTRLDLNLPLKFLGPGEFNATIFTDGSMDTEQANAINKIEKTVTASSPISIEFACGGGFTAIIRPK
jgi:alpha-glucosidase